MSPVDHLGGEGRRVEGSDVCKGLWWSLTYFMSSVPLLRSIPKDSQGLTPDSAPFSRILDTTYLACFAPECLSPCCPHAPDPVPSVTSSTRAVRCVFCMYCAACA